MFPGRRINPDRSRDNRSDGNFISVSGDCDQMCACNPIDWNPNISRSLILPLSCNFSLKALRISAIMLNILWRSYNWLLNAHFVFFLPSRHHSPDSFSGGGVSGEPGQHPRHLIPAEPSFPANSTHGANGSKRGHLEASGLGSLCTQQGRPYTHTQTHTLVHIRVTIRPD